MLILSGCSLKQVQLNSASGPSTVQTAELSIGQHHLQRTHHGGGCEVHKNAVTFGFGHASVAQAPHKCTRAAQLVKLVLPPRASCTVASPAHLGRPEGAGCIFVPAPVAARLVVSSTCPWQAVRASWCGVPQVVDGSPEGT